MNKANSERVPFRDFLQNHIVIFDGAMGTMLQQHGLKPGEKPELLNLKDPKSVIDVHRAYVEAGADVITTNTFQANEFKIGNDECSIEDIIAAGVQCARQAGARYIALDVGPLGQLMEPMGSITFEKAYEVFKRQMVAGEKAGVDLILIETVFDLYEIKAAVIAAKESTNLPIICSMTFQDGGRTFTGCEPLTQTVLLKDLGVDAFGVNCSLGPRFLKPIADIMLEYAGAPIIVQSNAGLPVKRGDEVVYELTPEEYADQVMDMVRAGVKIVGGCCGTTPEHIRLMKQNIKELQPVQTNPKPICACTSGTKMVVFDAHRIQIGERLNPTGKQEMQEALLGEDTDYFVDEAYEQIDADAQVLDVNVGMPGIDEPKMLAAAIRAIQEVAAVPLSIDSADPKAIEAVARVYNGKPIINSVNGKRESMAAIFPIAKKYGALVVCMTLDENGIPDTAAERVAIAKKIRDEAAVFGIPQENLLIDCLALPASTQPEQEKETLSAIRMVKEELGLRTILGISNISFGLPDRESVNAAFLEAALGAGLDAAILDPLSDKNQAVLEAFCE